MIPEPVIGFLSTVFSAGVGAWLASWIALRQWRFQTWGKRKAEVAEDVLSKFYEVQIRAHLAALLGAPDLNNLGDDFRKGLNELLETHGRFAAVFGEKEAEPFGVVFNLLWEERTLRKAVEDLDAAVKRMKATCEPAIRAEGEPWWARFGWHLG